MTIEKEINKEVKSVSRLIRQEAVRKIEKAPPKAIRNLPAHTRKLVARCLEKSDN